MRIAFVGCGAAGRALAVAWRRKGHAIGAVHARTSAAAAVKAIGAGVPDGPLDDADVVVFDPARVQDHATFAEPHQYATGIEYVVVNGEVVLDQGRHTGARPGAVLYGPGRR